MESFFPPWGQLGRTLQIFRERCDLSQTGRVPEGCRSPHQCYAHSAPALCHFHALLSPALLLPGALGPPRLVLVSRAASSRARPLGPPLSRHAALFTLCNPKGKGRGKPFPVPRSFQNGASGCPVLPCQFLWPSLRLLILDSHFTLADVPLDLRFFPPSGICINYPSMI